MTQQQSYTAKYQAGDVLRYPTLSGKDYYFLIVGIEGGYYVTMVTRAECGLMFDRHAFRDFDNNGTLIKIT